MQMERLQASHQADQGVLQAAMDSLQAQSRQPRSQHKRCAWQLAALWHWKRQGARQLRKLLHSWAMLTAASRSRRAAATASLRDIIRNSCKASCKGHEADVSGAQRCQKEHSLVEQSYRCTAGAEEQLEGPMPDGWAHHDRRMLGGCFRGTCAGRNDDLCHASCNVADAASPSTVILSWYHLQQYISFAAAASVRCRAACCCCTHAWSLTDMFNNVWT